jgi:crossover junction endodeoxyribonuclease RuvC
VLALGIDPGTLHLGYGLVSREGSRMRHVAHGVIRTKPGQPLGQRLLTIADELSEVIAAHRPELASVESLFFHKDAQAAAKLGHARGVVLLCLERARVPIREHAPARVKRTLVGNGQADKRQVAQMVRAVLALSAVPPSDAADALALAITELRIGGIMRPALEAEAESGSPRSRLNAILRARGILRAVR